MSDTNDTDRLALLEAQIANLTLAVGALAAPTPLAAVPPITVGELTDVPAPGSPIASAWAQEVSNRIVQRFATKTALDGWAAANGSIGYTADTGLSYQRFGGAWLPLKMQLEILSIPSTNTTITGTSTTVGSVVVPSQPWRRLVGVQCSAMVGFPIDTANQYQLSITHVNGAALSIRGAGGVTFAMPMLFATMAAGAAAATVKVDSIRTQGAANTAIANWTGQVLTFPIP